MPAQQSRSLPARTTAFRKRASATAILRTGRHRRCRPLVFVTEVDSTLGKVVRGHFDGDSIAGEDADAVFLHPAGRIGESLVPIVELYSKTRIGEQLLHGALELDQVFLSQTDLLYKGTGATKRPRVNVPLYLRQRANSPRKRGRVDLVRARS